jgi:hypothetical protein
MALRLIEVFVPSNQKDQLQNLLKDHHIVDSWQQELSEGKIIIRLLLEAEETGAVLDLLGEHSSLMGTKDFRMILLPVEASVPRPQAEDVAPEDEEARRSRKDRIFTRIIEELGKTEDRVAIASTCTDISLVGIPAFDVSVTDKRRESGD